MMVVVWLTAPAWLLLYLLLLLSYAPHSAPLAHTAFGIYPVFFLVGLVGSWWCARRTASRSLPVALLVVPLIGTAFWFATFAELAVNGA